MSCVAKLDQHRQFSPETPPMVTLEQRNMPMTGPLRKNVKQNEWSSYTV